MGEDDPPLPPIPPANPEPTWPDLAKWDRKPQLSDLGCLKDCKEFRNELRKFDDRALKATGTIRTSMSLFDCDTIIFGYDHSPTTLWNDVNLYVRFLTTVHQAK
jgi:hypothetical protein